MKLIYKTVLTVVTLLTIMPALTITVDASGAAAAAAAAASRGYLHSQTPNRTLKGENSKDSNEAMANILNEVFTERSDDSASSLKEDALYILSDLTKEELETLVTSLNSRETLTREEFSMLEAAKELQSEEVYVKDRDVANDYVFSTQLDYLLTRLAIIVVFIIVFIVIISLLCR